MPDIVESMKKAALEAVASSKPVDLIFGLVTSASPLEITIEQKLVLTAPMLILTRNVTEFNVDVTVGWSTETALGSHKHKVLPLNTEVGGDPPHPHAILEFETELKSLRHAHPIEGRKSMTVHNALQAGEYVLLIRMNGGQQYVVIDRVV